MPEESKIFNQKNCYRTVGIVLIITITALATVLIIKGNPQGSSNKDEDNENSAEVSLEKVSPLDKPENCYPIPDGNIPQFVIGYGSLMQAESKLRSHPTAGENIPVNIHGFSRQFNIEGRWVGFSTTYLGIEKNDTGELNAVIFKIPGASPNDSVNAIKKIDDREWFYCRVEVPPENIQVLNKTEGVEELMSKTEKKAQFWMYYNRPTYSKPASAKFPIVQSYVDIFISGCMELEKKFSLDGFAKKCVTSTQGWSTHWVNDRHFPRRPFASAPKAFEIDTLLAEVVPDAFKAIKIEG